MKLSSFIFLLFFTFFLGSSNAFSKEEVILGKAPEFSLTNQNGKTISLSDLKGKVWIADFIFTRCQSQCPLMTMKMQILQEKLPGITFVSFSVDPEFDRPEVLARYAKRYLANQENWFFLTGTKENLWRITTDGFQLGVGDASPEDLAEGSQPILHSERFVLVDRNGGIRGYYDSTEAQKLEELARDARQLTSSESSGSKDWLKKLPALNAGLNATSALLIILGLIMIRQHAWTGHALCMCFAMVVSTIFLISYLYYHYHHGITHYSHYGWIRPVYFTILISHTILAITVPPLVIAALYQALRSQFLKHIRVAKIAFPVWLYVSVTGVVVYWMLYQM